MNERDFRYLVAIGQTGNLGLASAQVHVTQPALTKCIDRLEAELGVVLFERRGRQLVPTEVGEILIRRAKSLLHDMAGVQREIREHALGTSGHVRIGAAATATETLLPEVIRRARRETPGITLELMVGMGDFLRDALREDRLDLLVSPAIEDDEFVCAPILEDQVVVVASEGHPLARGPRRLADLARYDWVLPPSSVALRRWLERAFEAAGVAPPTAKVEVNSLTLMPRLIRGTDLLSFTSRRRIGRGATSGLIELPFPETTYRRAFAVLHRGSGYFSPACRVISGFFADAADAIDDAGTPSFESPPGATTSE
ncbi:MAG: LysR family transcriptional regulator [Rhodovulum sulfidophilum]|uniref:LysR family transcriptional regulator n=1 Tax=Rhodovulum sulfidophilum TaxID=35806 RepID=A0A2W5QF40_RHOSU|nr:MAG: LysR family transcriptional regulator [Rhodovulum sulfidophilum]